MRTEEEKCSGLPAPNAETPAKCHLGQPESDPFTAMTALARAVAIPMARDRKGETLLPALRNFRVAT